MKIVSVSEAKPQIGRLIDQALRGEPVVIRKGGRMVQLTEYVVPEPIPERPVGFFRRSASDYATANRASVDVRPVR